MKPAALNPRPSKIVCVGRNYVEHAKELGNVVPERPLIFLKPPSAIIGDGDAIVLPEASQRVEHEAEIGVVIGVPLRHANPSGVLSAVAGITCVNDVTARDLPPWEELEVICRVNGVERQHGHAKDMVFGIPEVVAYISRVMTLEPGDLIATGSPSGVGPLQAGDTVEVEVTGVGVLRNRVVAGT